MTTFVFLLFFTFCYLLRTAFLLSFPFFNYFLLYLFICSSFLLFVSISALHFCFYLLFLFPPCTFAFTFYFYFCFALYLYLCILSAPFILRYAFSLCTFRCMNRTTTKQKNPNSPPRVFSRISSTSNTPK